MKINKFLCASAIVTISVMVPVLVGSKDALAICLMPKDMNGGWFSDNGGLYSIREFEGEIWWIGVSADDGKSWTNMFHGKRKGKKIKGTWISRNNEGKRTAKGTLELEDKGGYYINKKSTGDFPSKQWSMPCSDTGDFGASVKYPQPKHGLPVPIYIPVETPKPPIQPLSGNSLDGIPSFTIFHHQNPMECQVEGITIRVNGGSPIAFSSAKGVQCFDPKKKTTSMEVPVREISPDETTCTVGNISIAYSGSDVYIFKKKDKMIKVSCGNFDGRFLGVNLYQDKDLGKLIIRRFDEDLGEQKIEK